jgi:hypothetical protein
MDCSWKDNCSVPHSLFALDLQMNTKGKFQYCDQIKNIQHILEVVQLVD